MKLALEDRKQIFKQDVFLILESPEAHLVFLSFVEYWTEHNPNGKKMRFEGEKYFDINRRLQTWIRNDKKFNPQKNIVQETIKKMPGNYLKGNHFKERQSNSETKKISELIKK